MLLRKGICMNYYKLFISKCIYFGKKKTNLILLVIYILSFWYALFTKLIQIHILFVNLHQFIYASFYVPVLQNMFNLANYNVRFYHCYTSRKRFFSIQNFKNLLIFFYTDSIFLILLTYFFFR